MKKRAIILHPAIAPYRVDFFNSLAKEFDASFYFEFDNALEQAFDQEKLRKRLCFVPRFLSLGFMGIKNLRLEVLTILWKNKADVVFVSEYNLLGLLVCFYKLLFNWNLTVVSICDDNISMAQGVHFVKKLTRYVMLHILSIVVLADNNVLTWYENNLRFKSKYVYFPIIQSDNFFRERLLKALSISVSIADKYSLIGKKNILYVGRLVEIKNVSLLLKAFRHVNADFPDARLLIVGDGDLREDLESQVQGYISAGLIRFMGKQEGLDLLAYYNLAQIFVLPSLYEPFGTVVNEALLSGCYTLCSSIAGSACLIDEPQNGLLFDPSNESDLCLKLKKALIGVVGLEEIALKGNKMQIRYVERMDCLLKCLYLAIN